MDERLPIDKVMREHNYISLRDDDNYSYVDYKSNDDVYIAIKML